MYDDMPIDQIDRNPAQPRKHFDADLLEELAQSIRSNGLLEPIVVRPIEESGRHLIVAGERRWRASQIAGLSSVPVRVMRLDDATAFELSVAENVNRADMSVMEEAESFRTLIGYGRDVAQIAKLFGKSQSYVEVRLSFLDLIPDAAHLLGSGQIAPNLARYIAALNPANQRTIVAKWARGEFHHEIDAAHFARALKSAEEEVGFFDMEETTVEEREEHARRTRKVKSDLEKMEALAAALAEFADADPADLARHLGAEAPSRFAQIERIRTAANKAHKTMQLARAHVQAQTVVVRDDVVA